MHKLIILGCLLVFLLISSTFQYLVSKNKIKPSKLSRIFYKDNDSFIKSWEKTKQRGVLMWFIKDTILYLLFLVFYFGLLMSPSFDIIRFKEYRLTLLVLILIIVIFMWATNEIRWNRLEDKYNTLKEKLRNESINNIDNKS